MAKRTNTQQPQPTNEAAPVQQAGTANVIELRGKGGKTIWAEIDQDEKARLARRAELLGTATQKFAMAADLFQEGKGSQDEATQAAADGALLLYQGRVEGVLDADMVSAELGRIFGFKMVKDTKSGGMKPGKTPDGQGEAIRKRVVRMYNAHEFAVGDGDGGTFFEGLDEDAVADVLNEVESGNKSIWTAYDDLQKIKSSNSSRPELAYDAARIAKLATVLGQNVEASAKRLREDRNLVASYRSLLNILNIIGEQAAA